MVVIRTGFTVVAICWVFGMSACVTAVEPRPHIEIRGIYGGVPSELLQDGATLQDFGVNAIFMGSRSITNERLGLLKKQGVRVFAEFNTMHVASFLKDHPDAAPILPNGLICPAPHGWQGICPTHPDYRRFRMAEFRKVLTDFEIDGIWLDYHHSHASWERAAPNMPDTCFCDRCVDRFAKESKLDLPNESKQQLSQRILNDFHKQWVQWRCDVFTDWVRECRSIIEKTRPQALLGTFHCPWTESENEGALRNKLAIDLKAQAPFIDVFSIMPYHARFGHPSDPAWISRQTAWLGDYLDIRGTPNERPKIWPIVQLSDWGEAVPLEQVPAVLDHGTRRPATGVMVFAWGSLRRQLPKVEAMGEFYRSIRP